MAPSCLPCLQPSQPPQPIMSPNSPNPGSPKGTSRRQFTDDRKAVRSTTSPIPTGKSLDKLRQCTPPSPPNGPKSSPLNGPKSSPLNGPKSPPLLPMDMQKRSGPTGCASGLCTKTRSDLATCLRRLLGAAADKGKPPPMKVDGGEDEEHRRRWYRVHPITDELYSVRPDAGLAGRSEGHPDAGKTQPLLEQTNGMQKAGIDPVSSRLSTINRKGSVPHCIDRMVGLEEPGLNDTFVNFCKLCYDRMSDVVILPCRHGGFCEFCLRQTILKKPEHKGGRQCPWCRKRITEVIKLYNDGAVLRCYGYAISVGSLTDK